MAVIIEKLNETDRKFLSEFCQRIYLDGQCYEFAIATARGTGWPMLAIMKDSIVRHVVVMGDDGMCRDARGIVSQDDLGKPFGLCLPYDIKPVTVEDLRKVRPLNEPDVRRAGLMAEVLWPEWPWRKQCFGPRVSTFLTELEKLCRKHKLWIRAPFPTTRIVIDEMYGDESFQAWPTVTGPYIFDRYLERIPG